MDIKIFYAYFPQSIYIIGFIFMIVGILFTFLTLIYLLIKCVSYILNGGRDSVVRVILNFLNRHWIISSLLMAFPPILDHIIMFLDLGKNPFHIREISTCFIIIISIINVLRNYGIKLDVDKRIAAGDFYHLIIDLLNRNTTDKIENIQEIISKNEYGQNGNEKRIFDPYNNPSSRLNPQKHIKEYCRCAVDVLANSFGTTKDDIVISVFYKESEDKEWIILYSTSNPYDISSDRVVTDPRSSFYKVKDNPGELFVKNKSTAFADQKYLKTDYEDRNGLNGTIFCHNISIVHNGKLIMPIVLNIASFDMMLFDEEDEVAKEKAMELFRIIENSIKYEFAKMVFYCKAGLSESLTGSMKEEKGRT